MSVARDTVAISRRDPPARSPGAIPRRDPPEGGNEVGADMVTVNVVVAMAPSRK
jgi:hypothetical protein